MHEEIQQKRDQLSELCRMHHVQRLALFGSASGEGFYAELGDLDFLVEFQSLPAGTYADAYFGLMEGLQGLFRRPVDRVVESAIKNPYFLKSVQQTRRWLYFEVR